ncbi:hypothetical protein FSP39_021985 [Pinctada imbricata]|uniref:DZIP3-like HEPN domain-containing protein n=1 Tax=Pinctada imbricata TaxID=66713 RepID=A0AA89BWB0_PINIB|nr:hypothetical protein FSP39_021985 [Pinctada imbricata]
MSSKYHSKLSQLLHDTGGKTFGKAIEHFCLRTVPNLPTFLDNKKHALFHLWKKDCCCKSATPGRFKQVLKDKDWYSLFSRDPKAHTSCRGICACQFKAIPSISMQSKELDLTMKCMLISNVCPGPLSNPNYQAHVNSVRKAKNYIISHTDTTKIPEGDYTRYWNEIKPALCEIAKIVSEEFFKEIEDEIDGLFYEEDWNRRLKSRLIYANYVNHN